MKQLLLGLMLVASTSSFAADTICSPKGDSGNIVLEVDSVNDSFEFLKPGSMVQYSDTLFYEAEGSLGLEQSNG